MSSQTSIIIPALNEAAIIGEVVRRLRACQSLRDAGISDIVVVDNGSTDATSAVARAAGARVVWEPRRGYGRACLTGIYAAPHADIIVQMDGDGSDVPDDITRVWAPVSRGDADLVMGSRTRGSHEPGALTPQQIAGNAVGASLMRLLYGVRLSDIGPLRAIRRETLLRMQMAEMTYGWSAEMLVKAGRLGLRIAEVPVDYRRRGGGTSKVAGTLTGTVKASSAILRTITRYARWQPADGVASPPSPLSIRIGEGEQERHAIALKGNSEGDGKAPPLHQRWRGGRGVRLVRLRRQEATHRERSSRTPRPSEVRLVPPRRALFIVARLPIAGQTKTRLAQGIGDDGAADLYRAFLHDLGTRFTAAARRDGYDLVWFYAAPGDAGERDFAACVPAGGTFLRQGSGDLGARLWQGFQHLQAQEYEQIVVLSSDSPHVPAAWIDAAFQALATHDVVIGPAHDGGYYLLGQRGAPLDLFTSITMSTADVCMQTMALARAAARSIALAPSTFDIDYLPDLALLQTALEYAPSVGADSAPTTLARLRALDTLAGSSPVGEVLHAQE